jgi:hypothetical protein
MGTRTKSGTYAGNTNVRIDLMTDGLMASPCCDVKTRLGWVPDGTVDLAQVSQKRARGFSGFTLGRFWPSGAAKAFAACSWITQGAAERHHICR